MFFIRDSIDKNQTRGEGSPPVFPPRPLGLRGAEGDGGDLADLAHVRRLGHVAAAVRHVGGELCKGEASREL